MTDGAVERLAAARRDPAAAPAAPEPELAALPLEEAYRLQDRLVARLGERRGGYKIGATSRRAQEFLGLEGPFAGQVLHGGIHASPARLRAGAFRFRLVEPEFAVTIGRDLPPREAPYRQEEMAAAVATVHPALEIVCSAFGAAWRERSAPELIVDNGAHGALVLGTGHPLGGLDLAVAAAELHVDGAVVGAGQGANALGHPLAALAWLATQLSRLGRGLAAGEVVTTGVVTPFVLLGPGQTAVARFGALGEVAVSFSEN